jgi:hypothetical protein
MEHIIIIFKALVKRFEMKCPDVHLNLLFSVKAIHSIYLNYHIRSFISQNIAKLYQ